MTITVSNHSIPLHKLKQFHEILCATGGRYIRNPYKVGDVFKVSYTCGDYVAQQEAWNRCTQDIKEIRKDTKWRTILRRFGIKNV